MDKLQHPKSSTKIKNTKMELGMIYKDSQWNFEYGTLNLRNGENLLVRKRACILLEKMGKDFV